ncbi:MAG: RNA polymerase factor sigma-54 [Bacteroidota bacterium]
MLSQQLQQKLYQKLSPQQILLMKLLQIPAVSLEQRIKEELEENPALEDESEAEQDFSDEEIDPFDDDANSDLELAETDMNEDFDISEYLDDDETPGYKLSVNNSSDDDEYSSQNMFVSGKSFQETLIEQLGTYELNDTQYLIGLNIIGNIDDSGYLQRDLEAIVDDLAFTQNINTTSDELLHVLKIIQEFDPPGVGARNLQECLVLQLKRFENQHKDVQLAIQILQMAFVEFSRKHYDKIIAMLEISEADLKRAMEYILKLNPKPGNSLSDTSRTNQYIIPDFVITYNEGMLELSLTSKNIPELRINRTYSEMLETYSEGSDKKTKKDTILFVKQKIDSAKWFIDAIKQRQNTLMLTMTAIMEYQKEYFLTGDDTCLKPMILKDIADIVSLDISTISRVANSKYVQCPFGVFPLKSFFSESMSTDSGEEVSTREVKKILTDCIENENKSKPLTDDQLGVILKEKGYNIARRTVAKYREQLNISVARLRKEL